MLVWKLRWDKNNAAIDVGSPWTGTSKIQQVCPELSRNSLELAGLLFATGRQWAGWMKLTAIEAIPTQRTSSSTSWLSLFGLVFASAPLFSPMWFD